MQIIFSYTFKDYYLPHNGDYAVCINLLALTACFCVKQNAACGYALFNTFYFNELRPIPDYKYAGLYRLYKPDHGLSIQRRKPCPTIFHNQAEIIFVLISANHHFLHHNQTSRRILFPFEWHVLSMKQSDCKIANHQAQVKQLLSMCPCTLSNSNGPLVRASTSCKMAL